MSTIPIGLAEILGRASLPAPNTSLCLHSVVADTFVLPLGWTTLHCPTLFDFGRPHTTSSSRMGLQLTFQMSQLLLYPPQHATNSGIANTALILALKKVGANSQSLQPPARLILTSLYSILWYRTFSFARDIVATALAVQCSLSCSWATCCMACA